MRPSECAFRVWTDVALTASYFLRDCDLDAYFERTHSDGALMTIIGGNLEEPFGIHCSGGASYVCLRSHGIQRDQYDLNLLS